MSELYALPDHEVIDALLPWINRRPVEMREARRLISCNKALLPIAIDPHDRGAIYWADLGVHPFREWQYIFTIKSLSEAGEIKTAFKTSMDVLLDDGLFADSLQPEGFVFHISRCGSTLLAKSLARFDENLVINQGAPLQHGFWAYLTKDWSQDLPNTPQTRQMFRNLVRAMTRPRISGQRRAFVKFISWNTLYIDFIMQAFPDGKALYLYRNPAEVIASVKKATTAALTAKGSDKGAFLSQSDVEAHQALSDTAYLARCYAHYFKAVLNHFESDISCIEYPEITARNLKHILNQGLGYFPSDAELDLMREQFAFHSKDDDDTKKFEDDTQQKRDAISAIDTALIEALCGSYVDQIKDMQGNVYRPAARTA
ncbi:MAG: sulfotransferase [Sphingomonadales bacterium]